MNQVVTFQGRLDVHTVPAARERLSRALTTGTGDLVVDLSAVDSVDAAGVGVLVAAADRAPMYGRRVVLRAVPPRLARLMRMTRLTQVLTVESAAPRPGGVAAA